MPNKVLLDLMTANLRALGADGEQRAPAQRPRLDRLRQRVAARAGHRGAHRHHRRSSTCPATRSSSAKRPAPTTAARRCWPPPSAGDDRRSTCSAEPRALCNARRKATSSTRTLQATVAPARGYEPLQAFTTCSGRPSRKAMMLSTGMARERALASRVTAPTCGVSTTLGRSRNGLRSGGSGSSVIDVEARAGDAGRAQGLGQRVLRRPARRARC